jgi:hypothetical protein
MIVDVTKYDGDRFEKAVHWLNDNISKVTTVKGESIVLQSESWRLYSYEHSIEGIYETSWMLEFDNDTDATAFLLRWS